MKTPLRLLSSALALLAAVALRAQSNYATPYAFTTLAGNAANGTADGAGSAARFYFPGGVTVDAAGNVYVADTYNYTIRKITPSGMVTTVAGLAGTSGAADGAGNVARFYFPGGVAVDAAGNIYVADTFNYTIRKSNPAGVVTTLAGSATGSGSSDGTGSAARFSYPQGLAMDAAGNIYVADTGNSTIRKITPAGVVTTLAGIANRIGSTDGVGTLAQFNLPQSVAVDGAGNVYVADTGNNAIRKITPDGVVTTFMGSGEFSAAGSVRQFNAPSGIATDSAGNLCVVDDAGEIWTISSSGMVADLASLYAKADVAAGLVQVGHSSGVAMDSAGGIYVADSGISTIRKISRGGVVTTLAGKAGGYGTVDGTGSDARFSAPVSVAADTAGNIYVADGLNSTIRKIAPGGIVTTLAGQAKSTGVTDGMGSAARFYYPSGLAVDGAGNVYVADTNNDTIRKITSNGVVTTLAGVAGSSGSADGTGNAARFSNPSGVAVDGAGNIYVADAHTIRKITPGGVVTTLAGSASSSGSVDGTGGAARFSGLWGIAADAAGNLYVTDTDTIRKITSSGVVTTLAGQAGSQGSADGGTGARFYSPDGIAVDGAGNVYVADTSNRTIRKITSAGVVTTLAGTPGSFGAADGTGSVARFGNPWGVAVDSGGNVYVADTYNNEIRLGTPPGARAAQTISFAAIPDVPFGQVLTLAPTSSAGLSVGLSIVSGPATVVGHTVTVTGTGRIIVRASQAGDAKTVAAAFVDRSFNATIPPAAIATASKAATPTAGDTATLTSSNTGSGFTYQWQDNGTAQSGATSATLTLANIQPANAGLYTCTIGASGGASGTSDPTILGVATTNKVIGAGIEIAHGIYVAANGNTFDQVLPSGPAVTVTAEPGKITRTSFLDLTNDIVQVEFSGAGTLSLVLDSASGPVVADNYNQPGTGYMKGHAGIVITGADDTTNVAVFSVGPLTAVNQSIFKSDVTYDGMADLAFIAIASTNGKFGSVRTANATYYAAKGYTGIYAPGVQFSGPVYVGDISASDAATPVLLLGSAANNTWITGGDLLQANGQPVKVSGITQLKFMAGSTSHGTADLPAQTNKAVLLQGAADVTAQIVVNPASAGN